MTTIALPATSSPARAGEVDNRAAYLGFGSAYVLGHGSTALSQSSLLALPGWLPPTLLVAGLAAGTVFATLAAARAQRGADKAGRLSANLLGLAWVSAFAALFLAITGLSSTMDNPELSTVLWPAGSGLVVGLLYLAEGTVRRNLLHYGLGTWLALVSAAALSLGTPGLFWLLTAAGGGGYAVAVVLEHRRLSRIGLRS
ncbi:ABC transporter permease [Actinophytocola xanthii]|uniref:ABC transporter permease n=1 Tax=Actinophytocola xanthii TaxID=1912961 RepID=A0A1Q8C929_9PSEU|nr:ABC transporter permease [Actinophytocola xanthii]OLF10843.1 ABC transporter permease [Actinophytocola xanthii]